MSAIITLTTDFGAGSPYVASMKGVMLGINPSVRLIDLSHEVGPQDVIYGAVLLAETTTWFPAGTIHVAVVDPGVGTTRRLLYARIGDQHYLAPDNGLLSLLAKRFRPVRIVELTNSEYWLPAVSNTFHGRDIFAPVAGQLSLGLEPERLGPIVTDLNMLDWPEPQLGDHRIDGAVRWTDRFGNLITNIPSTMLAAAESPGGLKISCFGKQIHGTISSYGVRQAGELTALVGSSGFLEIAVVYGSAVKLLNACAGAPGGRRVVTNMPSHDELRRWDREHVWHAFTQMAEYEPFVIERAHGCTLVDLDGREYLDGTSSLWCNLHGHRHPRLDQALREQMDRVAHVTNLGMSNATTIELARRLVEITPAGLNHVFFSDDGATAVEVALKMAFQYWRQRPDPRPEKNVFVALGDAYHGDTLGSVSVGGVERFHAMFEPLLFKTIRVPAPDMYRLPPGVRAESALPHYLAQVEQIFAANHRQIAAMVVEPLVQCAAGMLTHPKGFLSGLRRLCDKYDVLLIVDEVAVGFGRTGRMFACEHENVVPDFLCLAKGITGGYMPLAATLATDGIWKAFLGTYAESKTFFHGHTYGGNPLGAAVALANLRIFDEERTLEQIEPKIARLSEHLARISKHCHVGDVRQRGLIAGIELVRNKSTKEPYPWEERRGWHVCQSALEDGVFVRPLGNVVVIMPPLAIRLDELDRICTAVERGIEKAIVD